MNDLNVNKGLASPMARMRESGDPQAVCSSGHRPETHPRAVIRDLGPDSYLRLKQIVGPDGLIGVSRSTFYALVKAGAMPRPIRIGARISVWRRSDLIAYIERAEAANEKTS